MSDPPRSTASRASSVLLSISSVLLSAMMILIGLVLLLPGICAGFVFVGSLRDGHAIENPIAQWIILGFAVAAGGVVLIGWAVLRLRSSRN